MVWSFTKEAVDATVRKFVCLEVTHTSRGRERLGRNLG